MVNDTHGFNLVSHHSSILANLENRVNTMERSVESLTLELKLISHTLSQVKNWIVGGVSILVIQQLGFFESINLAIQTMAK